MDSLTAKKAALAMEVFAGDSKMGRCDTQYPAPDGLSDRLATLPEISF